MPWAAATAEANRDKSGLDQEQDDDGLLTYAVGRRR